MQVFVVGATGVLGRALVPLLAARGHRVRGLARSSATVAAWATAGVELVAGDLLASEMPDRLPGLLAGCEVVVHAATAIPREPAAPGAWDATTRLRTEGARRLLAGALAAGARGYIQQSIVMAYPDGGDRWLDEATPLDTEPERAPVCAPVAAMEALVRGVNLARLRWCILRGGFFVGPGTA
ncbi:MAG TPA: NAD-dependent epimerase/dehydratase family protein, partial [Vicinamibacteria bacterium]